MQASLERLRRRREELEGEGGFTLIELLIVIVILGILAAIVVFAVQNLSGQSAMASCNSDYKTVETAVEAYKSQMGGYPNNGVVANGPTTDSAAAGANAAATSPSPLLTPSGTTPNGASPTGQVVGPWLKDAPVNGNHYTIWVSNDGLGTVTVGTGAGVAGPGAATCTAANVT